MRDLLRQIEQASNFGLYYAALFSALAVPDVCAALEAEDGGTNRGRYIAWCDRWLTPKYRGTLSGETCYYYRCGVLHQGRAQHPRMPYSRIAFIEPGTARGYAHDCVFNDLLLIDIDRFVHDVTEAALEWWRAMQESKVVQDNWAHTMQRYPDGLPPHIRGVPMIA